MKKIIIFLVYFIFIVFCPYAEAIEYGGVDFPCGDISFADAVVSYEPDFSGGPVPDPKFQDPLKATGVPDHETVEISNVPLGIGGRITLQFVDNYLTGSGDDKPDLWIFEIGGSVEETYVEISNDGDNWHSVGKALGSTSGVNIDAYGFGNGDLFSFVRLTDDPDQGDRAGPTVGADIDAVGASCEWDNIIEIEIDIIPGVYQNNIDLESEEDVPVAILTTSAFDAKDTDPTSCWFANASPVNWNMNDIDDDGDSDMQLYFKAQGLILDSDSTEATLTGKTYAGMKITGTDSVNIVSDETTIPRTRPRTLPKVNIPGFLWDGGGGG